MGKVYLLENLENDVQIAGFPSPQRYIPIIRYAIEKCMMEDANSIDAIYVGIVYTPISSYFGSKYALRHTLRRTGNAYVRVPYPRCRRIFQGVPGLRSRQFLSSSCG